jgi:5-oxoprolinase (ATP-hydrolysing)
VGVDSGGTFTDAVGADGRIAKVLSTRDDPSQAVRAAAELVSSGGRADTLAHGTTVATNAVLEGTTATVALVTTAGFGDVIEIGRQTRPRLFDHFADRPVPLVPRDLRLEVDERLAADGSVLTPVDVALLPEMPADAAAVAVCLLHADLNPEHERLVAARLRADGHDVSASHEVAPEIREFERMTTTVLNAALRPVCRPYLAALNGAADDVLVMTSAGGLTPSTAAAQLPAALLLSGPAAGVAAAAQVARANGFPDAVSFDMGGTSTDVCLITNGRPEPAGQRDVAGRPVRLPSLDVHTIGAGGGSVAWIDAGGALRVGPRSAGADPGPACYGRGGTEATVTDADLVAGRIPTDAAFGDLGALDIDGATSALARLGVTAEDVLRVVDEEMGQALRAVTVERGVDPRGLALVAFGGAGPVHACRLAESLDMTTVIVPAGAGVLSAVGLVGAPTIRELVRTWPGGIDHTGLAEAVSSLAAQVDTDVDDGAEVSTSLDCRYAGQGHELRVERVEDFPELHRRRNGYDRAGTPVEVVAVRARASVASPTRWPTTEPRRAVVGPAVVADPDCTVHVPTGWTGRVGELGALILERDPLHRAAGTDIPPTCVGFSDDSRRSDARSGDGRLDPASLQILIRRLDGIAAEVGATLRRSASSPNIRERADCSAALFDPAGQLVARAEHIPVHLGSMPASVRAVIDRFGDTLGPGEQAVLNDPFAGGTHLNDITVVAPCWVDGRLVGWVANRAHHADLGGMAPGSIPPEATEIHQEGLRIPAVRLTDEVREMIISSSRTAEERAGDLDAQWGANVVGVARLAELAGAPLDEVLDHGERAMRSAISAAPDGHWTFTDVIDSVGPRDEQQVPSTIGVAIEIDGSDVRVNFAGTGPQRPGNVNAPFAVTLSAVMFALVSTLDPDLPANGGSFRPVDVRANAGTLVAAVAPVAVGAGNVEVSQRVADVCFGALAQALPDRVPAASQGTMNNVILGATSNAWVYYETLGGGQGGRPDGQDGMSAVHTNMTNSANTPIEVFERTYGMRVRALRIRRETGGAGQARGGDGLERELETLEPVTVSLIAERHGSRPWGLAGGEAGAPGEHWLLPGGDESRARRLGDKCSVELAAGDVLRIGTPGGGGWSRTSTPPIKVSDASSRMPR